MASNLQIIINGVDQASDTFSDVGDAMSDLTKRSKSLVSAGLGPLQSMLGGALKASLAGATAGLVGLAGGLASSVSDAADFQQGMADIQASMGASAEDTSKLKKLIMDLGIDPKLKVSAEQAAAAIGQLGTAGVSIDDILKGTARSTVLLANATGADFADAASIASDVSKLWSIDAGNLTHAVDGITAATVASKFNINDYRLALAQAGGVASTVGVSFDDFNTTIAAISPSFASGSDAGTSFKTFLQRLIPQSKDATEAMRDLGLITADGKNQFFTAGGQMKDMSDIVGLLNHAFSGLTEEQKNQQLSIIFGTDAMRAAAAMAGMTTAQFTSLQETMGKTDAADSAKTRMDTLKGSLEILSGTFDTLKLMVGDKFLPVLNDLVKQFNDFLGAQAPMIVEWAGALAAKLGDLVSTYLPVFVAKLGEWWNWAKQLAVTLLDVGNQVWNFITGVKTALQPVIDIVSRFVGLKEILLGVAGAFGVAAVVSIGAFVASIAPVIAVVGSAIAIAATLRNAWANDFGGIRETVSGALDSLRTRFGALWDFIKLFGPGALQEIVNWVSGNQTQFDNLSKIWGQVKITAQGLFSDLVGYVRNNLPGWISTLQGWGFAAWQWIKEMVPIALAKLGEWGTALFQWIGANLPHWAETFLGWATAAVQWLGDVIPLAIGKLNEWLDSMTRYSGGEGSSKLTDATNKLGDAIKKTLGEIAIALAGLALNIGTNIVISIAQGLLDDAGIHTNLFKIKDDISKELTSWDGVMKDHGFNMSKGLSDGFNMFNPVGGAIKAVTDIVSGVKSLLGINSPSTVFTDIGSNMIQGLINGLGGINPGQIMNTVFGNLRDAWNYWHDNLVPHFSSSAKDFIAGATNAFVNSNLGQAVNTAMAGLRDRWNYWHDDLAPHLWSSATDIANNVIGGLAKGIKDGVGRVLSSVEGITDALPQWVKDKLGIHSPSTVFAGLGENIIAGLVEGMQSMAGAPQAVLSDMTAGMMTGAAGGGVIDNSQRNTSHVWNVTIPTAGGNQPTDQMQSMFNTLTTIYAR